MVFRCCDVFLILYQYFKLSLIFGIIFHMALLIGFVFVGDRLFLLVLSFNLRRRLLLSGCSCHAIHIKCSAELSPLLLDSTGSKLQSAL